MYVNFFRILTYQNVTQLLFSVSLLSKINDKKKLKAERFFLCEFIVSLKKSFVKRREISIFYVLLKMKEI